MRKRGGELKKVSDLFSKYRERLVAPQSSVVAVFLEVVEDLMGFAVKSERVSYSPGTKTIYLSVPSVLKQEILRNKKDILNHLKGRLGEKSAPKEII